MTFKNALLGNTDGGTYTIVGTGTSSGPWDSTSWKTWIDTVSSSTSSPKVWTSGTSAGGGSIYIRTDSSTTGFRPFTYSWPLPIHRVGELSEEENDMIVDVLIDAIIDDRDAIKFSFDSSGTFTTSPVLSYNYDEI